MFCPKCGVDLSKPQPGPLAHEELESYTDWLSRCTGFSEQDYSESCFDCPTVPGLVITVRMGLEEEDTDNEEEEA